MALADELISKLEKPKGWLVTGAAGFIGSNLVKTLLENGQIVVGLDNFSTGYQHNLDQIKQEVSVSCWNNFSFIRGDIRSLDDCLKATNNVDYVLHHAALPSVPASIVNPIIANEVNVTGFVNMLDAARKNNVKRFVYASSSAVYGDLPELPKKESAEVSCKSPYAANKYINEVYAATYSQCFNMDTIGLRYFNVFGPRQDPNGAYAAVISKWMFSLISGEKPVIYGNGENTRDFIYVDDVVQANILSALAINPLACNQVYNVGLGYETTLNTLYSEARRCISKVLTEVSSEALPEYAPPRKGDILRSYADITKAKSLLNFTPEFTLQQGMQKNIEWHCKTHNILKKHLLAQEHESAED